MDTWDFTWTGGRTRVKHGLVGGGRARAKTWTCGKTHAKHELAA